ncbi:MAG: hypothetical protein A2836_00540 [Candidatus Taylorbacteria bacterium RIFCSPHIGHO2_01_FULL_45_63]|uniref:Alanine--tRNA ligase n=1 Tax=Candidatus Taylorbacteria bacterium RIFCSPHIGHO2_02_FULL_45_35 TaxID=1802311 RepID=A0A1G2MPB9_9BACT|nr:MAG: hypothetical protein A2836_00540 [Candidatus Taylorbacteria bacterium RIFCSPHIGHO2_01_FULL_45_63]OHA25737.1 MAG: hypothetical protein A3D56_03220 [Candidatus Taylorbacteria bacterium RIFCSPHIGHO2_02_FULL_45_35]
MDVEQIRNRYLKFFEKKGHTIIPSAPLVPENDPTTLFTGSGMQPLVPYLLGAKHPGGARIVDVQKCFRAEDIDEVGDNRHTTFFEMLGNWSFGDYFKKEQLPWMFEFLTKDIGIPAEKIYVTVFAGDEKNNLPRDTESVEIWKELFKTAGIEAKDVLMGTEENIAKVGMQGGRIFYYGAKKNWWSRAGTPDKMPVGEPGGPDSEIFFDFGTTHDKKFGDECHPNCDCGRFLEIGNNVFMEYRKSEGGFEKLPARNVDFGGGLERIAAALHNEPDVYKLDVFADIIFSLEKASGKTYSSDDTETQKKFRIIADHTKAATFLIADGVMPSNKERGYALRRHIRRACFKANQLGLKNFDWIRASVDCLAESYGDFYTDIEDKKVDISKTIEEEAVRFSETLETGMKMFSQIASKKGGETISGEDAFVLFTTYGFPLELTLEVAQEKNIEADFKDFTSYMEKHQEVSRAGSDKKFKGGLADTSEMSVKYHTATHLLHQALHDVLGDSVSQKGSNITPERLRFDFTHSQKMTDEEKRRVEEIVNEKIVAGLPVNKVVLPKEKAFATGARHAFNEKYGDEVNVYYIGETLEGAYSKELCGGPHVSNTSKLGHFKIVKEEAVSQGVRRIKAILE